MYFIEPIVFILCHVHNYVKQIQVQHPAAKSLLEISRTQDEEVGDGTTSVIILGKIRDKEREE